MWLVIGLILGALILGLVVWMRSQKFSLTWYEWLIGAVGTILLLLTIQNVAGSYAEVESTAAMMFLLFMGIPSIVLIAVAWGLVAKRQRAT